MVLVRSGVSKSGLLGTQNAAENINPRNLPYIPRAPIALSQRSVDSVTYGGDGIGVDDLLD